MSTVDSKRHKFTHLYFIIFIIFIISSAWESKKNIQPTTECLAVNVTSINLQCRAADRHWLAAAPAVWVETEAAVSHWVTESASEWDLAEACSWSVCVVLALGNTSRAGAGPGAGPRTHSGSAAQKDTEDFLPCLVKLVIVIIDLRSVSCANLQPIKVVCDPLLGHKPLAEKPN